jgi:hypothetical protein
MNNDVKYNDKPSIKDAKKKLATKPKQVEKNEDDQSILVKIDKILNPQKKVKDINHHDGDELMALYSINQGKKAKDSLTYRSRMNRNTHTHYKYLVEELEEHSNRVWWDQPNSTIDE